MILRLFGYFVSWDVWIVGFGKEPALEKGDASAKLVLQINGSWKRRFQY